MKTKIDILNFEWSTNSRDTNIIEPVLCYIEEKYKLQVIRESYTDYIIKLYKYKPKMLLLSNYIGSPENYELAKVAHKMGIKVVSLISEGNIKGELDTPNGFWGWNQDRKVVVDLMLLWSSRTKRLINKVIPQSNNMNVLVSGATGFDRYKILDFMSKESFLSKYNRSEEKIILITGWTFELVNTTGYAPVGDYVYSKEESEYLLKSRDELNRLYERLIVANPDILFVLKYHPANLGFEQKSELWGLDKYDNAISLMNEEPIADVINVCDLLITFDSTTSLEAWLLGKPTIVCNPLKGEFKRLNVYEGSLLADDFDEIQKAISELYKSGQINAFEKKEEIRSSIIKDVIEYDDGKNHIRAAQFIINTFNESSDFNIKFTKFAIKELLAEIMWKVIGKIPVLCKDNRYVERLNRDRMYVKEQRNLEMQKYRDAIVRYDCAELN